MNRLYISNFFQLPILAKTLWQIPKYLPDYPYKSFNKTINLIDTPLFFSITGSFSHKFEKTDKFERNTFIKSHLEIVYENNKLEEICNYQDYGRSENLYIQYCLKNNLIRSIKAYDKLVLYSKNQIELNIELQEGNREISDNFISPLDPKTVDLINRIKEIIEQKKDKCIVN